MNITKEALIDEFERQNQIRSDQIQNQKNLSNITGTSSQLLEKMSQAVQTVTVENMDQKQRVARAGMKLLVV